MKINIFFSVLFFFFLQSICFAHIDVVYPVSDNVTVEADSIFFIGNTTSGADFTINSEKVNLWEDNFFVHVVPLSYGKNDIKLISIKNGVYEEKNYTITRPKTIKTQSIPENKQSKPVNVQSSMLMCAKTIKENATIREKPSSSSKRIIDLPKDVVLYLSDIQGDYYKIQETGNSEYWIHKSNIESPVNIDTKQTSTLEYIEEFEDEKYNYVRFLLNYPVFFDLKQEENSVILTLHGINKIAGFESSIPNYIYRYTQEDNLMGYDAYYDNNSLILRIAKTPKIKHKEHPLKGIAIFIDPGHGGSEKGSVGPTGICEKDINLAIAMYLAKYLKKEGANVIISREDDTKVDLYDRVKMAKVNNALISISIHNNALPSGKDPYIKHGTEVHYYNENAKLLAEIIQSNMAENLNFKDNGIHKSSFALNRSTNPVSVLVECAYMINPEEYIRLKNPITQKKIAHSIRNSLKKYIIAMQN